MRGGGEEDELAKINKEIARLEEIKELQQFIKDSENPPTPPPTYTPPPTPPPPSGFEGTKHSQHLKYLWGDYCHRMNEGECKASDYCTYNYTRSENKCANNYGDIESGGVKRPPTPEEEAAEMHQRIAAAIAKVKADRADRAP
jgi:hypothetical protein